MDREEDVPLSARSVSSTEDGSVSSRSRKSKTLARLRKLKKTEGSAQPNNLAGLHPHPPDSQNELEHKSTDGHVPSNGLTNGFSHDLGNLDKDIPSKSHMEHLNGAADERLSESEGLKPSSNSLSTLGNLSGPVERKPLGSSLFASPLDPAKPARRGLGGLEPLTPLAPLEPMEPFKKEKLKKTRKKVEKNVHNFENGENEGSRLGQLGDISELSEVGNEFSVNEGSMRISGATVTESSDTRIVDLPQGSIVEEKPDVSDSRIQASTESAILKPIKTVTEAKDGIYSNDGKQLTTNFGDSVDLLPDNSGKDSMRDEINYAVSSAGKEGRTLTNDFHDGLKDSSYTTLSHSMNKANVDVTDSVAYQNDNSFMVSKRESESFKKPAHEMHASVTIVDEEDDESDDDLIIVSPLPTSPGVQGHQPKIAIPETKLLADDSNSVTHGLMTSGRTGEGTEGTLLEHADLGIGDEISHSVHRNESVRSLERGSDGDDDDNDDDEDKRKLTEYLALKQRQIEEEGENNDAINSSSSNLSRGGRLSPIASASTLPPLDNNFMSPALRTSYKRDDLDDSVVNSEASDAMMSNGSLSETHRSFASTAMLLTTLTNKGARKNNKSYLSGGVRSSGSLVGKEELDSHLPDRKLKVFVATWNMHEDKELPENLEELLLPDDCEYMQDVYVIGTQESCPDLAEWEIRLQETLGPTHVLLHSATHGVLHCAVFIRRDLIWFCSPVEESRVSTRPGSMIKTKGAVAVSFNFFGTSLIFIVSHFTSGDENLKDRLLDYEKILKGISLPEKVPPTRKFNILTSDVTTRFDCVFWCGDFNFRLVENKPRVEGWIEQLRTGYRTDYDVLLQYDQLIKAMRKNEIFKGFREGTIKFLPSYKFDVGEDVYDTSSKARVPSYTDRVLYKSRKASDISLVHYNSCEQIKTSDHRPVYALFEVDIRPGRDDSLTGGGMFSRPVYVEAIKRRAAKAGMTKRTQASSAVCSVM
ncbi:uncharacterized protein [Diadema antillarum]|uniref:uncharacterized protein n=1 Tax=Diadema antillarum TaxID=105358 RepID=UPI003A877CB0